MERPAVRYFLWGFIVAVQIHGLGGCFEEERMALLQFKEFVRYSGADADRLLPSWVDDSGSDCCGWERVTCNSTTGYVIGLSLHNIKQLQNYTHYYDHFNKKESFKYLDNKIWFLNVSIFRPFKELTSLNLSLNEIGGWFENEGFENLSTLKRLETLDLGFNKVNMSIMQPLSAITSLRNLILNNNHLKGSFPAKELSALENLEMLNLGCNWLNGSLSLQDSKSLSKLSKLKQLNLSQNILDKKIIRHLGALPVLNSLDLLHNNMYGQLENADLADLRSLKILILRQNNLRGVLPVQGLAASGSLEILDLSDNIFVMSIPPYIGMLTSLKALSLSKNRLKGSLPSEGLCKLERLEEFDVSKNQLEGTLPSCLKNLTSLRVLDLSSNKLEGGISSSWIASLTSLEYIDLGDNQFQGLFPFNSFANHSQLEMVRFTCDEGKLQITETLGWIPMFQLQFAMLPNCFKMFSIEIPTFLFHQYKLRVVDLSYNKLKGKFPIWLVENNTRLENLNLKSNSFSGPLHLPLHGYPNISWMDVSGNQLYGNLQENIGNLLPNVIGLDLSKNDFEGSLPSSIGNISSMEKLDVSFNGFSGVVPKELVEGLSKLRVLKLSTNHFHGDLYSSEFNLTQLEVLDFSGNQFNGTLSKKLLKFAPQFFDGSSNYLYGKIPNWICNRTYIETLILHHNLFRGHFLCKSLRSGLEFLDLSHNFLLGSLPSWSLADQLKSIHLEGNNFSGSIPEAFIDALINPFSNMPKLLTLDISDNNLSGSIPSLLGKMLSLKVLQLNGNSLSGVIPSQLCYLINLRIMDLSNNFFFGSIPSCFHNITFADDDFDYYNYYGHTFWDTYYTHISLLVKIFQTHYSNRMNEEDEVKFITKYNTYSYKGAILDYMSGLDFSSNSLTGSIPPELGMISLVRALNLSHNRLTGSIPKTFSNLTQIESLDLSHNNLSGEIPSELNDLHSLAVFTVAYNNLSGRTPEIKGQFITFDERSYEGNPLLHGPDFNINKRSPLASKLPNVGGRKWYEVDRVILIASFFGSYFIFFIGAVTFLYIHPHWLRRCFNLSRDSMYSCYYFVVDTLRRLSNNLYN